VNDLYKLKEKGFDDQESWQIALESLVALVAPFTPHTAEELWHELGHSSSVHIDTWPKFDEKYLVSETMTIAVQVNGKLRGQIELLANTDEPAVKAAAEADEKVKIHLEGKQITKTFYVPGKILNIVAK
jgi:leucyl-tRNA synthetase